MRKRCWNGGDYVKSLKTKAWAQSSGLISSWQDIKKYRSQVWSYRRQIKFIAETQCYACQETVVSSYCVLIIIWQLKF